MQNKWYKHIFPQNRQNELLTWGAITFKTLILYSQELETFIYFFRNKIYVFQFNCWSFYDFEPTSCQKAKLIQRFYIQVKKILTIL